MDTNSQIYKDFINKKQSTSLKTTLEYIMICNELKINSYECDFIQYDLDDSTDDECNEFIDYICDNCKENYPALIASVTLFENYDHDENIIKLCEVYKPILNLLRIDQVLSLIDCMLEYTYDSDISDFYLSFIDNDIKNKHEAYANQVGRNIYSYNRIVTIRYDDDITRYENLVKFIWNLNKQ